MLISPVSREEELKRRHDNAVSDAVSVVTRNFQSIQNMSRAGSLPAPVRQGIIQPDGTLKRFFRFGDTFGSYPMSD